jgi:ketosteroid isomerase-like protein
MRTIATMACLLVLLATMMIAQDVPDDLRATIKLRGAAERNGDADTWGRFTRDDALIADADGIGKTKAQWMEMIKAGKSVGPMPQGRNEKFWVLGNTVVRSGESVGPQGEVKFLAVWAKNANGVWQVIAAQRTPVVRK